MTKPMQHLLRNRLASRRIRIAALLLMAALFVLPAGCQKSEVKNSDPDQVEQRRQEYEQRSMRELNEG